MNRLVVAALIAGLLATAPTPAFAQTDSPQLDQPQFKRTKKARAHAPEPPDVDEEDQLSPRQIEQRQPARSGRQTPQADPDDELPPAEPPQRKPSHPARRTAQPATEPPATAQSAQPGRTAAPTRRLQPAAADHAASARAGRGREGDSSVACTGLFGKDSSHAKLAARFDEQNVAFTELDGPEGAKLMASVLFPTDPKRRLEVLWQDESARSETMLIAINGQSAWTGPKGLKLGMTLAAVEKVNGRPFKLSGFDQANGGTVADWQGGALDSLPGGCRAGVRLAPDAKATGAAVTKAQGKELLSSDAVMRAARPVIAEILIGY